jgi:hypothetical protein
LTSGEHAVSVSAGTLRIKMMESDTLAQQAAVLLLHPSFNVVAMGIGAAESIDAQNSIEKMLAHHMAVAHEGAMRMMDRALSYEHSKASGQVEACRCINASARLMSAFNDAALTTRNSVKSTENLPGVP